MISKIIFLTGSRIKLAHIRYLSIGLPIDIEGFREASYHASYEEPRIFNREQLLKESLDSAIEQIKKAGLLSKKNLFLICHSNLHHDRLLWLFVLRVFLKEV